MTFPILFCKMRIFRINFYKKDFKQNKIKFLGFNKSPYFCRDIKIDESINEKNSGFYFRW